MIHLSINFESNCFIVVLVNKQSDLETVNLSTFDLDILGLTVNHHFIVVIVAGEHSTLSQVDDEIEAVLLEGLVELGVVLAVSVPDHQGPRLSLLPRVARQVEVAHPP